MKRNLLFFILFLSSASNAQTLPIENPNWLNPQYPPVYQVKPTDNLLSIAGVFFKNPAQVMNTWQRHAPQIFPQDQISVIEREKHNFSLQIKHSRTVKLSPNAVVTRSDVAIPTIPMSNIRHLLSHPNIAETDELAQAPYLIANENRNILITRGDLIYARGLENESKGQHFSIVRQGEPYRDKPDGDPLAFEVIYLGEARLDKADDPATLRVVMAEREIRDGDRLLPIPDQLFESDFVLSSPATLDDCRIIAVPDGTGKQIGQYQVVVINRGDDDGIQRGHLLSSFDGGKTIEDPHTHEKVTLPNSLSGSLLVFKVFPKVSFALILKAFRAIHLQDSVGIP
ncbi:MAG: hypothetical protein RIT27_1492 [Pseudomonadota bacterium]|jgi:hypothetical protein